MRKVFIAGNWKMHKNRVEAASLAEELVSAFAKEKKKVMIAPPFTALATVAEVLKDSKILLGAQNMGPEEKGAHTGEISPQMLTELGVSVVILGHSERRHVYGEGDELINRKLLLALKHNLHIILCVGETLDEREKDIAAQVVENQVVEGLKGVSEKALKQVTIAYEPVWAIGTGRTATAGDADTIHTLIRGLLTRLYSKKAGEEAVIQYGGSVKPDNTAELMKMENIDGLLVGGASLTADTFIKIVKYAMIA
jgi:triosephosphate isomerase